MFERFTEAARRALFFARYEASELGSVAIETEHILLGLAREPKGIIVPLLALTGQSLAAFRNEVQAESVVRPRVPTSVEMPFAADTKRALTLTAEEADRLHHAYIGSEHMLLGLLRVEGSAAEKILTRHGLRLDIVRDEIVRLLSGPTAGHERVVPREELLNQIERIKGLVAKLAESTSDPQAIAEIGFAIHLELDSLMRNLSPPE